MVIIEKSIIQKVKDVLNVNSEIESNDLYDLLFDYRNTQHPDKYTDTELKVNAEEKFKDLNNLLEQLSKFIEQEQAQKKPSELIPYQKNFELIKYKQEVVGYEKEIEDLKLTIRVRDNQIEKLEKELQATRQDKLNEKTEELIKIYKPSNRSLFYNGLSIALIFIYSILSKSEKVIDLLKKYSPIDTSLLNTIVFIIFLILVLGLLKKYLEERHITKLSKKIVTPHIVKEFYNSIPIPSEKGKLQYFDEFIVYDFIVKKLIPRNGFLKFITRKLIPIYSEIALDNLKDIFIYNLLHKQLIEIANAENLDRKFRIKNDFYYPF